ncbi:MAG: DUF3987 domain-containing protein [Steroidobacteraceae bacterium]|jgi:hypothetical protein|nr:DUF3987 domain-containing protein [Steroidobacteraceae bacterium]
MSQSDYLARLRDNVPDELRRLPVWLLWRELPPDKPGDKWRKVPVYACGIERNGKLDTPQDRAQLVDFEAAAKAADRVPCAGLGVALGPVPGEGLHLAGLDFDGLGANPERDGRALEVMGAACSYSERSPSGEGLHVLGYGDCGTRGNRGDGLEIYSGGRFFTMTGQRVNGAHLGDITAAADLARRLWPATGKAKRERREAGGDAEPGGRIGKGGRNSTLYAIGRRAREAAGLNPGEVRALLLEVNRERCDPPLDEAEVTAIARSIGTASDWPEPVNILRDLEAPPLEPAEVPGIIGEFAGAWAEASGIDPGAVLLPALASTAALLDDRFSIIGDSRTRWLQSARLWALTIAGPGAGKTPAQRAALGPTWDIHRELVQAYERAAASAGEGDTLPPRPRCIVADTTVEALAVALTDNPRGLLVAADEFESWLGSLDLYRRGGSGSRDRGEWLRLFDGGPHTVERVQRGATFVPNFGASIVTATTPAALAKLSRELPEDGLLQRFLVLSARRIVPTDANVGREAEAATAAYAGLQRAVYGMTPRAHNGAASLTHEAGEALREFRQRNGLQVEAVYSAQPALAGHLAKHPALLLRLTLTLHAARIAGLEDERARDPAAWGVTLDTLRQAERLLHRLTRHAVAVYARLAGDAGAFALARDVARYILATLPDALERRDLVQRVASFKAAGERDQAEALRLLEDLGWLRAEAGRYRKAIPTHYRVSPRVAATFAADAEREKARREARRELLRDRIETTRDAA